MEKKITAIVLSAGNGKRMGMTMPKQYIRIDDKPILYYTISAFEKSDVDEIIIVCGQNDIEYCTKEIVQYFNFNKVSKVIPGGDERYHSVYNGLKSIEHNGYVLIHDGARPCIPAEMINAMIVNVKDNNACIMAVPVKDTIKVVKNGIICDSPNRNTLWQAQTPQAFDIDKIKNAYKKIIEEKIYKEKVITDDAQIWSMYNSDPVRVVEGNYENIKVTTKSDLEIVVNYIKKLAK